MTTIMTLYLLKELASCIEYAYRKKQIFYAHRIENNELALCIAYAYRKDISFIYTK